MDARVKPAHDDGKIIDLLSFFADRLKVQLRDQGARHDLVDAVFALEGQDEEAKIRWAFQQLKAHLEKAGATLGDVVELQSFHVARDHDEFRQRIAPVLKVHREFFKDHYPAWTAVGTTALYAGNAPMEVRAEAVVGSGARARAEIAKPQEK